MKKIFASGIVLLAIAASVALLPGCDEKKDDNSGLIMLLAGGGGGTCPWEVVEPADNSRNVRMDSSIVLRYKGGNLDATITDWDVTLHYNEDYLFSITDGSSTLTFDGDEVTVNPAGEFSDGVTYSKMDITGFKDAGGVEIESCRLSTYNFTTMSK